jgi:hypothetical protein
MDVNSRVLLPIARYFSLDLNDGGKFAIDQLGDGTIIERISKLFKSFLANST